MKDLLCVALWVGLAAIGLVGCAKNGDDGAPGAPGTSTTVITPASTPNTVQPGQDLPGLVIKITGVGGGTGANGNLRAGDTLSVTFTVKKKNGVALLLSEIDSSGIYVSGPSFNYQRVLPRVADWHTTAVQNADGSYTFTFASPLPAVYAAPYNDTAAYGAGDGELTGQALLDGTYTVGMHAYRTYYDATTSFRDVGNAEKDFLYGGAVSIVSREVVKDANCNQCHVTLQAHGGSRRDVKLCLLCHTSGAEDENSVLVDFRVMIHKIHNGAHLPSVQGVTTKSDGTRDYGATPVPYAISGNDFSEVNFPVWPSLNVAMPKDAGYSAFSTSQKTQDDKIRTGVVACAKCHGGAAQESLCYAQPSRRACGSCHDDVVWANPYAANSQTMPVQANDSGCSTALCHPVSGTSLATQDAHLHPLNNTTLNPGTNVAVTSVTGGTGTGGNFKAGDPVSLTFTVKNDAGIDIPLSSLDSASATVVGPTSNRQFVFSYPSPNGVTFNPFDFSGRLASGSTTGKGSMSKAVGIGVSETLIVQFSSATAFAVNGTSSGLLVAAGALAASPSTNPSGSSVSGITLTTAAVPQQVTISFSGPQTFGVTGVLSGAMGSGTLPAALSASNRFTSSDGSLSFIVTVGTTAFVAGNNIYLTVVKGAVANPLLFAIVAGRTSFAANDRFYYEAIAPAASYTAKIPMDIVLEYLGTATGGIQNLVAANLPVYYGRQTLYERTALVGVATSLAAPAGVFARYVDVNAIDAGLAVGDTVVLENGVAGKEEYVKVGLIDITGGLKRIWFTTPLRYAHAAAAAFQEATLTFRQEGLDYTLTSATGTAALIAGRFTAGNAVVMSYRTDGRFGWKRDVADTLQTTYVPPINDSPDLGQAWGDWQGLPFLDGTYTAAMWGYRNLDLSLNGEVQTYRCTSNAAVKDVLYGAATTVTPHDIIPSAANCTSCHSDLIFHGGGRRGLDACLMCHSTAGSEDWPLYNPPSTPPTTPAGATPGVTIDFRTMLHKIHRGAELANASTYTVAGNSGAASTYAEVGYPAMPGGTKHCTTCHGSDNTAWQTPAVRKHPSQTTPTRAWRAVCGSCHDSDGATAHFNLMTDAGGLEACEACHGDGADNSVTLKHKNR
jgi:OmcA/MtrC family decaheme c-type cytochrome